MSFEVKEWIDVTVWEPGPCKTSIWDADPAPMAITMLADKAVEAALANLGKTRKTYGNYKFYCLSGSIPPIGCCGKNVAKKAR